MEDVLIQGRCDLCGKTDTLLFCDWDEEQGRDIWICDECDEKRFDIYNIEEEEIYIKEKGFGGKGVLG